MPNSVSGFGRKDFYSFLVLLQWQPEFSFQLFLRYDSTQTDRKTDDAKAISPSFSSKNGGYKLLMHSFQFTLKLHVFKRNHQIYFKILTETQLETWNKYIKDTC